MRSRFLESPRTACFGRIFVTFSEFRFFKEENDSPRLSVGLYDDLSWHVPNVLTERKELAMSQRAQNISRFGKDPHGFQRPCLFWLLLLVLPGAVQAQFNYTTNNGAITITGYTGPGGAVIPSTINGLPVTTLGGHSFFGTSVTSATIPNSVTSIGDEAFGTGLTNVVIGSSVTNIGAEMFGYFGNALNAIAVDSLNPFYSSVDGVLFNKTQTTLILYPGGNAGSYTVPVSVTTIGAVAFRNCYRLTSVAIPDSVATIGDWAFCMQGDFGQTSLTNVAIPKSLTNIGDSAFFGCGRLTSFTIPNSVTSIGDGAFAGTGLTNVTIPSSVIEIGDGAFAYGVNLLAITVDGLNPSYSSMDGVLFDKNQTFLLQFPGAKVANYTVPNSVIKLERLAFSECSGLTSVMLPSSATNIGDFAFFYCTSLTNVTIPDSVISIGASAFCECISLENLTIPNRMTSIGYDAFADSGLINVTIPSGVTNIDAGAFDGCTSLTEIVVDPLNAFYSSVDGVLFNKAQTTLIRYPGGKSGIYAVPTTVIRIGGYAFVYCALLTTVTIPNSVTNISDGAFGLCGNLTGIYFGGNAPSLGRDVFYSDAITVVAAFVYYLPGTTGWGATYGGRPTALWNPQVLTTDATFGVRSNLFGFTTAGPSDLVVVIEAATNLVNALWLPVATNRLTVGSAYFSDPNWSNYPARFYRLRSQ
jgi:hypothetical protein